MSWLYFSGYWQWWNARQWEEVPCWIESAELKSGDDTSQATASYHYEYGGQTYHSDRVSFHRGSDNIGSFQQEVHREISRYAPTKPAGAEVDPGSDGRKPFRCYVNPANPGEAVLYRTLRWQMQAFMAIFALTFPAVGAGLTAAGLLGIRTRTKETALREAHPGEPWKWRAGWADASIPDTSRLSNPALHCYTLWSGLVIVPLVLTTALAGGFQESRAAWLLMIFVVLWAVPVLASIRRLRHLLAVGTTRFEPRESPASPGGLLHGDILMRKPPPLRGVAEAVLLCEKRVIRKSGDDTTTVTDNIWSHRQTIAQDSVIRDLSGFRLPVSFALPADAPESGSDDDAPARHVWKLEFKVSGTAIHSVFEVPVFRTAQSPAPGNVPSGAPSILDEASADLPELLSACRIKAEFDSAGTPLSIVCPPARHTSLIVFLILFDVIWTGVAVLLIREQAPLVFRIVWPVSAAFIWCIVFWNLLHIRTVTLNSAGLEVRNRFGPFIRTRGFEKSRITGFSHDTNMTSNRTSFHRVRLESVLGEKHTLADGIAGATAAAALVKRLEAWRIAK